MLTAHNSTHTRTEVPFLTSDKWKLFEGAGCRDHSRHTANHTPTLSRTLQPGYQTAIRIADAVVGFVAVFAPTYQYIKISL